LKAILVDDWENITKNNELVKLPSAHPVNKVLDTYFEEEKQKRRPGSADLDLLEEFIAGTKSYFTRCLGRILLYRFERLQYADMRKSWDNAPAGGDMDGKGPGDVYGAEHLARLVVKMPELIAQTNMDRQSVDRLREEMTKLCLWLGRNSGTYFTTAYEKPSPEYLESVKTSK
jgi:mortality factor 4-like protein 1